MTATESKPPLTFGGPNELADNRPRLRKPKHRLPNFLRPAEIDALLAVVEGKS